MNNNTEVLTWDLQEIIGEIIDHYPYIVEVYLFGSRSYKTNSYRSDIDILVVSDNEPAPVADVNLWLNEKYPPVDLFWSYDSEIAQSVINGSSVTYNSCNKWGYKNLFEQLDAKLLWEKDKGFSDDFMDWNQQTLNGTTHKMSIIPSYAIPDFNETVNKALQALEASGVRTFYAGSNWIEISKTVIELIEIGIKRPEKYQKRASVFSYDLIKISNEYDFQNMIQFILRPVFRDIQCEPFVIEIDGNQKRQILR